MLIPLVAGLGTVMALAPELGSLALAVFLAVVLGDAMIRYVRHCIAYKAEKDRLSLAPRRGTQSFRRGLL